MTPFRIAWRDEDWQAVRARIRAWRMPWAPEGSSWEAGCDPAALASLCAHWADGFDMRAAEAVLNRFPHVRHEVDGVSLHAVHVVGEAEGRRPLLLVHGWPGSFFEFWRVIEPLAFPSRFGGRAEDAFDLVIPSLPGFGFSGRPNRVTGAKRTAGLFDRLMREGFGCPRYLVQGGDWGAAVAAWMALDCAEAVRAIHLNHVLVQPAGDPRTEEERAWRAKHAETERALGGYSHLQGTKPQSLAYAMADDPVGQAAWIVERFHDWADLRDTSFEAAFDRDDLLTNIMIYVMNDAFASSVRFYSGGVAEGVRTMAEGQRVRVPTAFAAFPDPRLPRPPRSWVERGYDLVRWTEPERGGHFAAMEAPDLFVADVRGWAAQPEVAGR